MQRYGWTLGGAAIVGIVYAIVMAIYINILHDSTAPAGPYEWSKFLWWPSWLVAAIVALAAVVSIWGFVGVMIARAKAKIEALAAERVVISKNSWHYRLQHWMGNDPANIRGGCEYWPKLVHGLIFLFPGIGLLRAIVAPAAYCTYVALIVPLVLLLGWLVGARPKFFLSIDVGRPSFHNEGDQRIGPIVAVLVFIGGIISFVQLTAWGQIAWVTVSRPSWTPSWEREGLYVGWAFATIGITTAAVIIVFLATQVIQSLRPLVSDVSAFMVGKCSLHEYVD